MNISNIIKGKQIKTKMFHLLSIPLIKLMFDNKRFGEDMGKMKTLRYCWWDDKWVQSLWGAFWESIVPLKEHGPLPCKSIGKLNI